MRDAGLDIMTEMSGVGPTTERCGRARADRSNSAFASAARPVAPAPGLSSLRPSQGAVGELRRTRATRAKRRRGRRKRVRPLAPSRSAVVVIVRTAANPRREGGAFAGAAPSRRSGRFAASRHPELVFAHDARRWRSSRLRSARRQPLRRHGDGRRVGGAGASGRSTRHAPAPVADSFGTARAQLITPTSTPDRRRASRRRIERVRSGSGARLHRDGFVPVNRLRRRARPAQKSLSWQTRC